MAISINTAFGNHILDGFDAAFNSGTLEIRSGAAPGADNAAAGVVLATIALPADALATAAARSKAKSGTWQDVAADATGVAAHFRLTGNAGAYVVEGTVSATGGGGDLQLDTTSLVAGQPVTITAFTFSI